jgi:hypothetical protein
MAWKKAGMVKGKYIKFEAGKSFEGTYNGYNERVNPFYDESNSSKVMYDYAFNINGEDKILSSTAKTLQDQLMPLVFPCEVKVDMVTKGIKKWYSIWTMD